MIHADLPSDGDSSGRTFSNEALVFLREVLESGTLNSTAGTFVSRMEAEFSAMMGSGRSAYACNSGSAAVHTAVAALDLSPGTEIIVSPLTDAGGVAPLIWQGCIPVFADVDPMSLTVTPETVQDRLTSRTGAIIVTHLLGRPADVVGMLDVARRHGLALIEDCAQAYGATVGGAPVGTFGDLSCFSLQQTKHITTGEGGFVLATEQYAPRVHQFINKGRIYSDPVPEHHFLAMNYRMSELQGAVGLAQLHQLEDVVARRQRSAGTFVAGLRDIEGLSTASLPAGAGHSYWKMAVHADPAAASLDATSISRALHETGIKSSAGYQRPAYEWAFIRDRVTFGDSTYPFTLATDEATDYATSRFPGVTSVLENVLVFPWNEHYSSADVERLVDALRQVLEAEVKR